MTAAFHPRLDILPAEQRQLWPELRPVRSPGYVLYGGTAIALHLGHRRSVDFDFFCSPLDRDAIAARSHSSAGRPLSRTAPTPSS